MNQSRYISAIVPIAGTKDKQYTVKGPNEKAGTERLFNFFREGFEIKLSHVIEVSGGLMLYVILEKSGPE